ncbi:hypothetical protein NE237_011197 [Protea cynaroides]|uniref:Uncharacterized protein n=1 Tax=Protea cynaroides TaxID=273540 RepID=A0A9Q0GZF4_9MAGN|nr:hypothetical protein NE237_011197 [Protea cynaroides]
MNCDIASHLPLDELRLRHSPSSGRTTTAEPNSTRSTLYLPIFRSQVRFHLSFQASRLNRRVLKMSGLINNEVMRCFEDMDWSMLELISLNELGNSLYIRETCMDSFMTGSR